MAAAVALLIYGYPSMLAICANKQMRTLASPDATLEAVLFERDCGATTGLSSHLSIREAGRDLPDEGGNIFVADIPPGGETLVTGPLVDVEWLDRHMLHVRYDARMRIFKMTQKRGDIGISYERTGR